MKPGLIDKEFYNIKQLIMHRVPLNDSLKGKINNVADAEDLAALQLAFKKYGDPIVLSDEDLKLLKNFKNQELPHNEYLKALQSKYL